MSTQGAIKRYTLIIEKIGTKQLPSFKELSSHLLNHGFHISPRTIQRDIQQIRDEFGIEIKYNRTENGYFIDVGESFNIDNFLRFLGIVNTASLLTNSLRESRDMLRYISFEARGDLKGVEDLKQLLYAITNHRIVSFTHENFHTGKSRKFSVSPYLIKEYQNRWYLIGTIAKSRQFTTFGIDRISALAISDQTFSPLPNARPEELFEFTVGLTNVEGKPERVILSFTPIQAKYIKTLPIHKSQEIITDNETEVQVSLTIIPNYEFRQKILMLGDTVKVIKPDWLAENIKESLTDALKRYQ